MISTLSALQVRLQKKTISQFREIKSFLEKISNGRVNESNVAFSRLSVCEAGK